ncbi:MAG: plastocyanin/azurin family copper-binding protein [Chloroflexota bacterium]|jgi:plastocyanin
MINRGSLLVIVPLILFGFAFILETDQVTSSPQDTEIVTVSDSQFTPAQVTINVGDSVQWVNEGSLPHNVNADDGSFRSGDPATGPWTYTFTFNTPGTYPYHCEVHGAPGGIGMSGTIIVQGEPPLLDRDVYLPTIIR